MKARVVAEIYTSPNPFDFHMGETHLWEIIEDIMGKPGYHLRDIEKGELGEVSKIREEMDELIDAAKQKVRVMELVEMSDMLGAMDAYLSKHHGNYTIDDLLKMSAVTKRAFVNGKRQ